MNEGAADRISRTVLRRTLNVRSGCAPWKGGAFQWVQAPPGNRSSRKQFPAADTQADTLEQGETDRRQAAATAETRLGDPDQAPDRATNPRSGDVQSGHRQQIARLRCRRYQGRGRCSERLLCRPGNRAPEKDWATRTI